jgi:hypothetical protein
VIEVMSQKSAKSADPTCYASLVALQSYIWRTNIMVEDKQKPKLIAKKVSTYHDAKPKKKIAKQTFDSERMARIIQRLAASGLY